MALLLPLLLYPLGLPASASAAPFACTDDVSCSLNGVCGSDKDCACDPGWGGASCATLLLAPAAAQNGYRVANRSSWGGSVIKQGGTYHMFVEELVSDCGLNTYARNMRVAHAVSQTAAGPYRPVNLVTNDSASTPHAVRDPSNGDWLVYATGCGRQACLTVSQCANGVTASDADMSPCPDGSSGSSGLRAGLGHAAPCTCPKPGFAVPGPECSVDWGTNVFRAPSPDGPWSLAAAPLMDVEHPKLVHADGTPLVFANPSAYLMKNCTETSGTAALMYRDFLQKLQFPATNVIGLAWSHTGWRGPYLPADIDRKIFPDYAEDPFMWRGPRGIWHMLAHSLCDAWPKCPAVGGHAASLDGHTWHYSGGATYSTTVEFEGGKNITFRRRERPEVSTKAAPDVNPARGLPDRLDFGYRC